MNKNMLKNIALVLLVGITAFSMFRYIAELKARYALQDNLAQAQSQIVVMVEEKQNLLQEIGKEKAANEQLTVKNSALKDNLRASKKRMVRFFQDSAKLESEIEDTRARLSVLKAENRALIESRKRIAMQNEQFRLKLSSVVELKKAIRDLKNNKNNTLENEIEGNRGFLIKDGQLTSAQNIKIEVVPAQTKE